MAKTQKTKKAKSSAKQTMIDLLAELFGELKKHLPEWWEEHRAKIVLKLKVLAKQISGESLVVLGPPAAGKTTLLSVLKDVNIPPEKLHQYVKTEKTELETFLCEFNLAIDDGEQIRFKLKVKKPIDVGGENFVRASHWADAITGAKVVFYVFDFDAFLSDGESYKKRILDDMEWLFQNHQRLKNNFSVVFVANKIDKRCTAKTFQSYQKEMDGRLKGLLEEIKEGWSPNLKPFLKGIRLLSLTDMSLRSWTLNSLVLALAGEDLVSLYKRSKHQKEDVA